MTWLDTWPYVLLTIQVILGVCILVSLIKIHGYLLACAECLVMVPIILDQSSLELSVVNNDNNDNTSRYVCQDDKLCMYASFAWIVQAWIIVAYQIYRFTLNSDIKKNWCISLVIGFPYAVSFMYLSIHGWFPIDTALVLVVPSLVYGIFGAYVVARGLKRFASSNPWALNAVSIPKLCIAASLWLLSLSLEAYSDVQTNELFHRIATTLLFTSQTVAVIHKEQIRYQSLNDPSTVNLEDLSSLQSIQISTTAHVSSSAYTLDTNHGTSGNVAKTQKKMDKSLGKRVKNQRSDMSECIDADASISRFRSSSSSARPHEQVRALVLGNETDNDIESETKTADLRFEHETFDFMNLEMYRNRMYPSWYNDLAFSKTLNELGFCRGNISAAMCNLYIVEVMDSRVANVEQKVKTANVPRWCGPGFRRAVGDFCNADTIQETASSESALRAQFMSLDYRDIMQMETSVRLYLRTRFEHCPITTYIKFGSILESVLVEAEMYTSMPSPTFQNRRWSHVFEFATRRLFPDVVRYGISQIVTKYSVEIKQLEPLMNEMQSRSNLWSLPLSSTHTGQAENAKTLLERKPNVDSVPTLDPPSRASAVSRYDGTMDKPLDGSRLDQKEPIITRTNSSGLVDVELDVDVGL